MTAPASIASAITDCTIVNNFLSHAPPRGPPPFARTSSNHRPLVLLVRGVRKPPPPFKTVTGRNRDNTNAGYPPANRTVTGKRTTGNSTAAQPLKESFTDNARLNSG